MKQTIITSSIIAILFLAFTSFGCMDSTTSVEEFSPVQVGKTYKATIVGSFAGDTEITILEAPKGKWVKVNLKKYGTRYLNMDNVALITTALY